MFAIRRFIAASLAVVAVSSSALGSTVSAADATDGVYVVRSGDSIYGIAYAEGVSVTDLMSANDLEITSVIVPGQRLAIPGAAPAVTSSPSNSSNSSNPSSGGTTYTVVAGDSLSGIASKHGVRLSTLLTANQLQVSSLILPGQRLTVPGASNTGRSGQTAAAPSSTTSTTSTTSMYKIQPGDWLLAIASKHNVRLNDLLAVNGLRIDSVIHPGRLLKLPAGATVTATPSSSPSSTPAPSPAPSRPASTLTHTVVAGNSLSGIAASYSVKLADLLAVNEMQIDSLILPGQVIKLPAGAAATAPSSTPAPASTAPVSGATQSRIDTVVAYALAQVGKDYAFFTKGPDSFDCSGLTLMAYRQVGIDLVHWSAAQANQGTRVDLDHDGIRAGDLVFQQRNGSLVINHVGIAIDGDRWVHAVGPGKGVRIGTLPDASTISVVRRYVNG